VLANTKQILNQFLRKSCILLLGFSESKDQDGDLIVSSSLDALLFCYLLLPVLYLASDQVVLEEKAMTKIYFQEVKRDLFNRIKNIAIIWDTQYLQEVIYTRL